MTVPSFVSHGDPLPPVPGGSVDGLLARAAAAHPDRAAVVVPDGGVTTFAEADRRASGYARGLRALLGGERSVVLLSAALIAEFPALYYGIVRAGHVVAPANQLYPAELLEYVLTRSRARAAVVTPAVWQKLAPLRDRLPELEHVLLIGPEQDGVPSVHTLLDGDHPELPQADGGFAEQTACVLFTSGSTRMPKPVRLSHRNLLTGAVQLSTAHGQTAESVVLNGLPIYHPMHMNASMRVGATHVLSGGEATDALAAANRYRASHFYTLPFRLIQLANHPRLAELRLDTVKVVSTGGLPLRPAVLRALAGQFGVPVLQGYGMCESSSLATSDLPTAPRQGSVGRPLAGSRMRIVDLETRAPLAAGAVGEIQLAGPNVMQGYLVEQPEEAVDADGWLSTGDVGRLDADGNLFFLDRVRDVFRSGGELVCPGEIEAVLAERPEVAECAVVDAPDGEETVPVAFVVTRPGAERSTGLITEVNELLGLHQQLHRAEYLEALPRLPNSKVDRTALRKRVR
ncbi:class I adenylate-forming enzyme family protein [Kitasatospora terrestris]|uniref:AMP-binding protein n=1 Tax=Kitasatospora terrestris TaxID=258051 RepID=A0ABP9DNZ4_9ACTN